MATGTYTVGQGSDAPSTRDASFKSCMCALLVFIAICVIILLAGIKWKKYADKDSDKEGQSQFQGTQGEAAKATTPTSGKFVSKSVPATTKTVKPTTLMLPPTTKTTSTTKLNNIATTMSTVTSTLISIITVAKGRTTTSSTKLPNVVILQTESADESTISPQDTISKTTATSQSLKTSTVSNLNVKEMQNTTQNTDKYTTTYDDRGLKTTATSKSLKTSTVSNLNAKEMQNTTQNTDKYTTYDDSGLNTDVSNGTIETTTEPFTASVSFTDETTIVGRLFITKLGPVDQAESFSTEGLSDYTKSEPLEITNGTSEQPPTDTTQADFISLIFTQNAKQEPPKTSISPSTKPLNPAVGNASTTTTKKVWSTKDEGQKLVDDYEYFDDNLNKTTAINTQPTEKNDISMWHWPEKINTTTNSIVLSRKPDPVCMSMGCKSAASRMLSLMDHSGDACNDFYEFACGGMSTASTDFDTWKRLSEQLYLIDETSPSYLKTFKTFYDSCVSHEYEFDYQQRIDGVLKLVKEVGELFHDDPPKGTIDLTELFTKLLLRHSLPFMDIEIDIDKQFSNFILKLTLPRPTSILKESGRWSALTEAQKRCLDDERHKLEQMNLDLTEIYESYLECQKNHAIYIKSVETVAKALGFYSGLNNSFDESQKIQELRTTIEWDVLDNLNALPTPSTIRETVLLKKYSVFKISDLQIQHSLIDWSRLFNNITGSELADNTTIQVYFQPYFKILFQKLKEVDVRKLNNALMAMYAHNLYENLVIPQAKHTRENYCIKLSSKLFGDISSNLYMKTWHESEIKESQKFLMETFNQVKQNLKAALQKETWMDDPSLTSTLFKLQKMELTFNKQEDSYNNEKDLSDKYSAVTMTTDFQNSAVKMLEIERKMRYAMIGKEYSTDDLWSYFVNAYDSAPTSFYSKALIMAPLGMIKQPITKFPGYMTMARIGLSLAREIGRHFDPVGIEHEMTLTEDAQSFYHSLESNMENESLFDVNKSIGHQTAVFKVDPKLSNNERIADNTGFRLVSDGFADFGNQTLLPWVSTSFSVEQVFYITVAQEYCQNTDMPEFMQQLFESEILPASLRVENIMTNSKQFPKVFNCPRGSPMNNNPMKVQFPHLEEEDEEDEEY